jgi:TM2 domain-containing membrane protein YozV
MNTCAYHPGVPAVAYCRTCGKPLCENCKREVRGVVYCEACIAARLEGTAPPVAYAGGPSSAHASGAPNPTLAAIIGIIPGVGAFYNGQYQKGVIHVLMFPALIMLANINDGFGVLFPFYFGYMMWDAYVTAKSRITGEKVPDPLGINNLFGLDAPAPAATPPPAASAAAAPSGAANAGAAPPAQAFGAADYRDLRRAGRDGFRNGPIGAFILIGLGVLFLLGDISRHFVHNFWPVILIIIGVWKGINVWNVREPQ